MRDYPNGTPLGLQDACLAVRANVVRAAHKAIRAFRDGYDEDGRYWLGHVTHVIQDSFSPAHALRTGAGRPMIQDICVYGIDWPGICRHATLDIRDRVWRSTFACQADPNNRNSACLTSEAQDAVHASAVFLINAGKAIFAGKTLDENLQGYFTCENLAP